jgi:hypothetical protein
MALSGTASAAGAPTLTCLTNFISCPNFVVAGQGSSGTIFIGGTGFANDQPVGGNVTLTTTAAGVTFSDVVETSSTQATATITTSSTTPPGFYPVTYTDDNGSATMAVGLGVDVGPQVTTVAGNAATVGATSTVMITGTNLRTAYVYFNGTGTAPVAGSTTINSLGTTMSFTVNTAGATPGAWSMIIADSYPFSDLYGTFVSSYTVNASATPVTITGISPSELGIPAGPSSSNNTITLSGTGFETGAVVSLPAPSAGVTFVSSTFVNSSTMSFVVNVAPGATIAQDNVKILNPDSSNAVGTGILGIGEPAAAVGPPAPVPPVVSYIGGSLTPGTSSIITVQGSATFPLTTASTVKVTFGGLTNPSEILSGTVLSVDATNTATVRVIVPRFATSTLVTATTGASTTLVLADASGAPASGSVTVVDGASTESVAYTGKSTNTLTGVVTPLAHAAGVLVEWPFPTTTTAIATVTNSSNTEATAPLIHINGAAAATYTSSLTGSPVGTLQPGTYSLNAYAPGFGFVTGSTITFNKDNVTGTVTVVNGNTATLNVIVPAVRTVALTGALSTAASPGQNALNLSSLNLTGGGTVQVGDKITVNADSFYLVPETFTVTSLPGGNVVGVSPAVADNHAAGATLSDNSAAQSVSDSVNAVLTNGAGEAIVVAPFFGFSAQVTATPSLSPVGAGASSAPENFTLSGAGITDFTPANWTFHSATAGVSFTTVTTPDSTHIDGTISVAAGTAAGAVTFTLTDGLQTITGSFAVVAGPTITGVTAVGALTAGGSETVGITGTNFVAGMGCSTGDPAVPCVLVPQGTDSTTIRTITVGPVGAAALNGTDSISVTDPTTYGVGTLATGFTVSGQPTYTKVSPSTITYTTNPAITVTGTLVPASLTVCNVFVTDTLGNTVAHGTCTASPVSATSFTVNSGYYSGSAPGDTITFTVGNATSVATTPGVLVAAYPYADFMFVNSFADTGTLQAYTDQDVLQGSANVPFKFVNFGDFLGTTFLPGATLTIPATDGTITITQITPNAIFGTMNVLSTAATGCETVTVTNPGGGSNFLGCGFYIDAHPTVSSVLPVPVLNGQTTTVTLHGDGFYPGAVVTSNTPGLATFGTATVNESGTPCTVYCDTIVFTVSPIGFSGAVPILDGLTITNPTGAGSVSVTNAISVNPTPMVTGVYFVPTFTTNTEVTITGSGFESGITASSANPDYTVLAVGSTATTVTLLVTTDSNATSGTSSTITLTNPDGGSGTFVLNGGPNPKTLTPTPKATGVHGLVHTGKTSTVTISGSHFYGQPRITSNARGTTAHVFRDNGKTLWVHVTTKKTTPKGRHTFIIVFANGEQTSVKYTQVK